jgi:hypothetical protein
MKLKKYLDRIVQMLEYMVWNTMPRKDRSQLTKVAKRKAGRPKGSKNKGKK